MSILTTIQKIGSRIVSVIEWPIKHAVEVTELLGTAVKDTPELKTAFVGLIGQFDAIGDDVLADVASKGLDVTTDLKTVSDFQALAKFWTSNFVPALESTYADFKADLEAKKEPAAPAAPATGEAPSSPTSAGAAPSAAATEDAPQPGPGLHTVAAA